ncbi:MAG: tyrosine--tRNA ligase [Bacilli bacterium]
MKTYDDLIYRDLVANISHEELIDKVNNGGLTFYLGTDPTADSLHIGHYASLMVAKRLQNAGHNPIILVGGGTGLIGDPRPTSERSMISKEELNHNFKCIKEQIEKLIPNITIVNNMDWITNINVIDFLRDYGKNFPINYMINKETVKRRLDIGITYTEFSYMILQALDFMYLYDNYNCTLQIGGSDQWGNIISGLDLIHKSRGNDKKVYVMTIPLITKKDGSKFGKTESGTVWLDKNKTTPYELYQFFINSEDDKVIEYLKKFTFLSKEKIEKIEKEHKISPHFRIAQKELAKDIIINLHEVKEYETAITITDALFSGDLSLLTLNQMDTAFKNLDITNIDTDINIIDALILTKLASSKREAREFINNGAIYLNNIKVNKEDQLINKETTYYNTYAVLKRGKKKYSILKF